MPLSNKLMPGCCCGEAYSIPAATCHGCTVSASTLTMTWYYSRSGSLPGPATGGPIETTLNAVADGSGGYYWISDVIECPTDSTSFVNDAAVGFGCYLYFKTGCGGAWGYDVYTSFSPTGTFTPIGVTTSLVSCSPLNVNGVYGGSFCFRSGVMTT
jgi:hypothetical protein